MRAYDLFEEFKGLTQSQRDDAIGYFLGGVGMDFDGFTDAKERPGFDRSKYALDRFQAAIWYAQGVRVDILPEPPIEVEPGQHSTGGAIQTAWEHAAMTEDRGTLAAALAIERRDGQRVAIDDARNDRTGNQTRFLASNMVDDRRRSVGSCSNRSVKSYRGGY